MLLFFLVHHAVSLQTPEAPKYQNITTEKKEVLVVSRATKKNQKRIASRFLSNERHILNHPNVYAMYKNIYIYKLPFIPNNRILFFDFRPLERKFLLNTTFQQILHP